MMTKEDIKKALKCCCDEHWDKCTDCPYINTYTINCEDRLRENAFALITEQEKEIERLKAENNVWSTQINQAYDNGYKDGYDSAQDDIKQAKIDVLNELKEKCHNYYPSIDHYCCSEKAVKLSDIDELLKEYLK